MDLFIIDDFSRLKLHLQKNLKRTLAYQARQLINYFFFVKKITSRLFSVPTLRGDGVQTRILF